MMIEELLRAIGKSTFVNCLYPELKRDINVTIEEISQKHPSYKRYTYKSQKSRLSKARTIFKEGKEKEALELIAYSDKTDATAVIQAQNILSKH